MNLKHCTLALGLLAAASFGPARAEVTLTDTTVDLALSTGTETVPVYVLENQWLRVVIVRGAVQHPTVTTNTDTVIGQVLALYMKSGPQQDKSQLTTIGTADATRPGVNQGRSFLAYRDRINGGSNDPVPGKQTITGAVESGVGVVTVNEPSLYQYNATTQTAAFTIQKIYRLRDNVKWLEAEVTFNNLTATPYSGPQTDAAMSLIYVTPGGVAGNADPGDISFGKVAQRSVSGEEIGGGLAANIVSGYFGGNPTGPPTPNFGTLTEGWIAWTDPDLDIALATTWDLALQRASSPAEPAQRVGLFSNRATFEVYFRNIPANGSLTWVQNLIVDSDLAAVSYAKEGQLIAGVKLDKAYGDKYALGYPLTATFQLNSLNPDAAASYDIRNIRVEAKKFFSSSPSFTIAPINGVNVPANAHVTAGSRTITLTDPALTAGESYQLKGDLYVAGGSEMITTVESRPFSVEDIATKVFLSQDDAGSWVLENEVYKVTISPNSPNQSRVTHFVLKNADGRNQTITSGSGMPLFRDYLQTTDPNGSGTGFSGYGIPNIVVNTPTRKAIEFAANAPDGQGGTLTKTYALSSMSGALEVGYKFVNGPTPLLGGGIFSDVQMAPSGTSGTADTFFAPTINGLFTYHPAEVTTFDRQFLGETWDPANPALGIPGDFPELSQGWMATVDTGSVADATVLAWDLPTQKNFSLPMAEGGAKVSMNSFGIGNAYDRTTVEAHFTNIPANGTLDTKYYLIGDTGYKAVSYAEVGRAMAGIWPSATTTPAGAFDVGMTITNIGTTARTFDVKNIRVISGTTETVVGTDQTGIALAPATRDSRTLSVNLAGLAEGSYKVLADLYEGATKVATLETLAFTVTVPVTPGGDVDNDGDVDLTDATAALSIWGGLTAADAGNVTRGDLDPATPGITLEDVVAIVDKATP